MSSHRPLFLAISALFLTLVNPGSLGAAHKSDHDPTDIHIPQHIAAGPAHTCVIMAGDGVRCWGNNDFGQLGDGSTVSSLTPVRVRGISDAISIAASALGTCIVDRSGQVWCWGVDLAELLRTKNLVPVSEPTVVVDLDPVRTIAGKYAHFCAVLLDGRVMCWGANGVGQLGDGTTEDSARPVFAKLHEMATAVGTGTAQSCAVLRDGHVKCWGSDETSTGLSFALDSYTPVTIPKVSEAVAVGAGRNFACALLSTGEITCWGSSGALPSSRTSEPFGRPLGNPQKPSMLGVMITIDGIKDAVGLSVGLFNGCALLGTGAVSCWKSISSELGESRADISVPGISNAVAITSGFSHTCALLAGGSVKCWGENHEGQLGDGTRQDSERPVLVKGF